eukprot:1565723-Pleurochrysis_carterae.AAC.2
MEMNGLKRAHARTRIASRDFVPSAVRAAKVPATLLTHLPLAEKASTSDTWLSSNSSSLSRCARPCCSGSMAVSSSILRTITLTASAASAATSARSDASADTEHLSSPTLTPASLRSTSDSARTSLLALSKLDKLSCVAPTSSSSPLAFTPKTAKRTDVPSLSPSRSAAETNWPSSLSAARANERRKSSLATPLRTAACG